MRARESVLSVGEFVACGREREAAKAVGKGRRSVRCADWCADPKGEPGEKCSESRSPKMMVMMNRVVAPAESKVRHR